MMVNSSHRANLLYRATVLARKLAGMKAINQQ